MQCKQGRMSIINKHRLVYLETAVVTQAGSVYWQTWTWKSATIPRRIKPLWCKSIACISFRPSIERTSFQRRLWSSWAHLQRKYWRPNKLVADKLLDELEKYVWQSSLSIEQKVVQQEPAVPLYQKSSPASARLSTPEDRVEAIWTLLSRLGKLTTKGASFVRKWHGNDVINSRKKAKKVFYKMEEFLIEL